MQIKVFKASSMREAVAQMKQELGENAVILHTKKYKDGGFLGVGSREMIELTAAIEDEKPAKKELPTEKIEPPSVKVRPPSIVSQYKTSGTAEGLAMVEKAQTPMPRSRVEGVREELHPSEMPVPIVEKTVEPAPVPLPAETIVEEPEPIPDIADEEGNYIEEPSSEQEVEPTPAVAEPPPVERPSTSELLTAAMNIASSSEPVPQPEATPQAAPLPTELSNLTASRQADQPVRSEQLTAAPLPNPAQTVTLTTEQLAQMQAAMVAQTVAQLQLNTTPQPPTSAPSTVEPPKIEAAASTPSAENVEVKQDENERTEAERLSEEKIKRLEDEIAQMKAMLAKVLGRDITRGMMSLHEALRQQEVSEEILNDMAVTAGAGETLADSQSPEAKATLMNYLQTHMIFSEGIKLNRHGVRIAALLGTTGVGKTTTLAKIAAKFVLEQQVTAALITADTYRISAVEQLRTYSDILGLPLEIVYSPSELSKAIVKHRTKDLILIDTAGRSQYNEFQMKELQDLLSINQRIEKHLVLSVTTKQSDAKDIIERFSVCEPDKIIFTKTDETSTLGSIMNLLLKQQRLSLSYLSNGQSVPDDIIAATPEALTDLLLRS